MGKTQKHILKNQECTYYFTWHETAPLW